MRPWEKRVNALGLSLSMVFFGSPSLVAAAPEGSSSSEDVSIIPNQITGTAEQIETAVKTAAEIPSQMLAATQAGFQEPVVEEPPNPADLPWTGTAIPVERVANWEDFVNLQLAQPDLSGYPSGQNSVDRLKSVLDRYLAEFYRRHYGRGTNPSISLPVMQAMLRVMAPQLASRVKEDGSKTVYIFLTREEEAPDPQNTELWMVFSTYFGNTDDATISQPRCYYTQIGMRVVDGQLQYATSVSSHNGRYRINDFNQATFETALRNNFFTWVIQPLRTSNLAEFLGTLVGGGAGPINQSTIDFMVNAAMGISSVINPISDLLTGLYPPEFIAPIVRYAPVYENYAGILQAMATGIVPADLLATLQQLARRVENPDPSLIALVDGLRDLSANGMPDSGLMVTTYQQIVSQMADLSRRFREMGDEKRFFWGRPISQNRRNLLGQIEDIGRRISASTGSERSALETQRVDLQQSMEGLEDGYEPMMERQDALVVEWRTVLYRLNSWLNEDSANASLTDRERVFVAMYGSLPWMIQMVENFSTIVSEWRASNPLAATGPASPGGAAPEEQEESPDEEPVMDPAKIEIVPVSFTEHTELVAADALEPQPNQVMEEMPVS